MVKCMCVHLTYHYYYYIIKNRIIIFLTNIMVYFYVFHYGKSETPNTKKAMLCKVEIKMGCNHLQKTCVYLQQLCKMVPGASVVKPFIHSCVEPNW